MPGVRLIEPDVLEDDRGYFLEAYSYRHFEGKLGGHLALSDSVTMSSFIGGKKVWGDYPFFEAAYLGGYHTLYGFH